MATATSIPAMLGRGLTRRCPRCGQGKLFPRWFTMLPRCPRCDLDFERGEGFWLGSMAVNLGVTEAAFGIVLVGGIVLTWPDVPWVWLGVVSVLTNIVVPILFFPFSKTIFLALDLMMHGMGAIDRPSSGRTDSSQA
jgi:uncharacterized protein (DUF983 family)